MEALAEVAVRNDGTFELLRLDERSWVDVARGWVFGADALHETLVDQAEWRQGRLWRYERWVEEPRLYGSARPGNEPLHPVLPELQRALEARYRVTFGGVALAQYRDGRDGVAFHRDRELRWLDDTLIAVLSLGQRRPWHLRVDVTSGPACAGRYLPGPEELQLLIDRVVLAVVVAGDHRGVPTGAPRADPGVVAVVLVD